MAATLLDDAKKLLGQIQLCKDQALGKNVSPQLIQRANSLVQSANSLIDEFGQPVRVGVVGAFSSGKTRLIEALLGCAGSLYVQETPSTGNIVEFELKPSGESLTKLDDHRVLFMNETTTARPLLKKLLGRAKELIKDEEKIDEAIRAQLTGDLSLENGSWSAVQKWANELYKQCRGKGLKSVAFELYRLAYTIGQGRSWLGRTFKIDHEQAFELMSLSYDPLQLTELTLESLRKEVPDPPASGDLKGFSPISLSGLFPIVGKISITAKLSKQVVQSFGESRLNIRLVDCPGAGADGSNFRDEILCAAELENVDTVLAMLSARNPGQNRGFLDPLLQSWGDGAKERILAIVSRFDQLPHDQDSSKGKLALLAKQDGPLSVGELQSALPSLRHLLDASRDTVMDRDLGRVIFVSAMAYFSYCFALDQKAARGTSKFYRDELAIDLVLDTEAEIDLKSRHPWIQQLNLWQSVGKRLEQSNQLQDKSLGKRLVDFAEDGGISLLHTDLQKHLDEHGRKNLLQRLEKQLTDSEARFKTLKSEIDSAPAGSKPESRDTKGPSTHGTRIEFLKKLQIAYGSLSWKGCRDFQVGSSKDGEIRPLADALRKNIVARIFQWQQWQLLFDRVGHDGTVRKVDPHDPEIQPYEFRVRTEQQTPVKSTDFLAPFYESIRRFDRIIAKHKSESFDLYRSELEAEITKSLGGRTAVSGMREMLGSDELNESDKPNDSKWSKWLTVGGSVSDNEKPANVTPLSDELIAAYFPLQSDQAFYYAWHEPLGAQYATQFGTRHRHLMYVVRLRQAIAEAAITWLDDRLSDCQYELRNELTGRVESIKNELSEAEKSEPQASVPEDDYLVDV